jgi:hypothetical protein
MQLLDIQPRRGAPVPHMLLAKRGLSGDDRISVATTAITITSFRMPNPKGRPRLVRWSVAFTDEIANAGRSVRARASIC